MGRKAQVAGRDWDAFDGYLFDIDGTLLQCTDAVHYFAFCDALKSLSGRALTLEGVTAHGNTDVGILRDALALAEVPEATWRPRLAEIQQRMGSFVEERKDALCVEVLPQVREVLEHLKARGATLGIATGNLETIGRMKLERAGVLNSFTIGGWSDAYEQRSDVFGAALERMRRVIGRGAAVCVLGDTPADVLSAHANEVPVIAIATGVYALQQLAAANPDLCVRSLSDLLPGLG